MKKTLRWTVLFALLLIVGLLFAGQTVFAAEYVNVDILVNDYPNAKLTTQENQAFDRITVAKGGSIPDYQIPSAYRLDTLDKTFDGWYTEKTGGNKITSSTTFSSYTVLYAHWKDTPVPASNQVSYVRINNSRIINGYSVVDYSNNSRNPSDDRVTGGRDYTIYNGINGTGTKLTNSDKLDSGKNYTVVTTLNIASSNVYLAKNATILTSYGSIYKIIYRGSAANGASIVSDVWFAGVTKIEVYINMLSEENSIKSVIIRNPEIITGMSIIDYDNASFDTSNPHVSGGRDYAIYHGLYASNGQLEDDEVLDASRNYTVVTQIGADYGYFWDPNVEISSTNGTVYDFKYNGYGSWSIDAKYITVYINMPCKQEPITSVSLTVTEPKAGAKPDFDPVLPSGAGCDVGSVAWFDETGEHWMSSTESFAAGHSYTVRVDLLPKDGYEFDLEALFEGDIAKVNGKDADSDLRDSEDGDYLRVRYTFPAVAASVRIGDVNQDKKVDATDRMILSRYLAKWDGYAAKIKSMDAADIDRNGLVEAKDRMILARYLAKWDGYSQYFK
jgi:hypothetical protein